MVIHCRHSSGEEVDRLRWVTGNTLNPASTEQVAFLSSSFVEGNSIAPIEAKRFSSVKFFQCRWNSLSFSKSAFVGATFTNCTFVKCDFRDTFFDGCSFQNCTFAECLFYDSFFSLCMYDKLRLGQCQFEGNAFLSSLVDCNQLTENNLKLIDCSFNIYSFAFVREDGSCVRFSKLAPVQMVFLWTMAGLGFKMRRVNDDFIVFGAPSSLSKSGFTYVLFDRQNLKLVSLAKLGNVSFSVLAAINDMKK